MSKSVIVFGPTGSVAAIAARTAQKYGAKVILAMRDPSKTIPGLSSEQEKEGGYERLQADLTKPDTVGEVAKKSGAKHAFIYAAHGSPDHMKGTLEALKSGGVEFIVFLSSYTISKPLKEIPQEEIIPYIHAQVELNLLAVYGEDNFVALRPGGFATNSLRWKEGIKSGELKLYGPKFEFDGITPDDMGVTAGTILAKGAQDGQHIVYLYGPKCMSQRDMALTVAKVLGVDLKISPQTADQAREMFSAAGFPPPLVNYMIKRAGDNDGDMAERPRFEEGVENVRKYTGKPSIGFEDWVRQNEALYA